MGVPEQSLFYKTTRQIKQEAKDTVKGAYGKSIKANLLGIAVLAVTALAFYLSLTLLQNIEWLQITLCVVLGVLFVFFAGTVLVGNLTFYSRLHDDDAKIKDAFSSFNNIWKYGWMFIFYLLLVLLFFIISAGIIFFIFTLMYDNLWSMFTQGKIKTFVELINQASNYSNFSVIIALIAVFGTISMFWAIFMSIKYSTLFITVAVKPKQTLLSAFKQNKQALKDNKKRFVNLWLSLFGHYLLCVITAGIYAIWFVPYYQTCKVVFYKDLLTDF